MAKVRIDPPQLTPQEIKRFLSYIDKTPGYGPSGDCWKWTRATSDNGYGVFGAQKRHYSTHRLAYFVSTGIWSVVYVCHTCDWHPCCNPKHLFEGTPRQNSEDMARKNRAARIGRPRLTPEQVREIRALCASAQRQHGAIATRFGVSRPLVTMIANRKAWRHLD